MELTINKNKFKVKTVISSKDTSQGMMNKKFDDTFNGMLFIMSEGQHCFWMKNTAIPLAIAFIDASGKIINIAEMEAFSESNHCPLRPNPYALEMNRGWFSKRKLGPGSFVEGLPRP